VTNVIRQSGAQSVELYLSAPVGEFFSVAVANVANIFGSNINTTATGYTTGFASTNLGTATDPSPAGDIFSAFTDTFSVTASGSDIGGTNDHCQFLYQPVIGNFDVTVLVTRLDNVNFAAKAGLMAREYLTPGSKSVQTYFTPVIAGTNVFQSSLRATTNGTTAVFSTRIITNGLTWLRMNRSNNTFSVYYGTNGFNWLVTNSTTLTLNSNLYIGMATTAHLNGQTTTATFTDFGFNGKRPGDGVVPTISATLYQKTNLVVKWQRTPRDFTVQVTTNLVTSSGSVSNAMAWAFLMNPVFDTSLTGTNAFMPTTGRYMVIPTDLFSNSTLFVRLAQVDRVIPDPIGVIAGTVFSQANMTSVSGTAGICGSAVDSSTAVSQTNGLAGYLLCPAGTGNQTLSYQFTTLPSGGTLQTYILVKNYPNQTITNCDAVFTADNTSKSQVIILQTNTLKSPAAGYTYLAAIKSGTQKPTTNCPIRVLVNIITNTVGL
jgi:regulation of enolase protein 1 (concanavalin A-like superfamily)